MADIKNIPFLTTRTLNPENQESPIQFLKHTYIPEKYFYLRNHFPYPLLMSDNYQLLLHGEVHQPFSFSQHNLLQMPAKTLAVLMECAGNQRSRFLPRVFGEQWEDGALSQGLWKGVSLYYLLNQTGIRNGAKEIVFEGFDQGKNESEKEAVPFARSLPLEIALHPDTIIAYQYNQSYISFKHGGPLRLIVPTWYGMSSVKWLKTIKVINHSFQGRFQTRDYIYYPNESDDDGSFPVTTMNVNSIIQKPHDYAILKKGDHIIRGLAWTGEESIENVEVSLDNGETWKVAHIETNAAKTYTWTSWQLTWKVEKEGKYTICSRAKDTTGRIQPMEAFWNRKGYGYNAVAKVHVKVE